MERFLSVVMLTIAAVSTAACSSTAAENDASNRWPVTAAATPFGASCGMRSSDSDSDPVRVDAMSKVPVTIAAAGDPALSTLVVAVDKAGLGDTLNNSADITVFAPDNDAFAKIPAATLNRMLADEAMLTKILTYHVVPGRLTPAQLPGRHKTLQGDDLTITGRGARVKVDDADIVCGAVQTANATVYILDSVLMPKS